MAPNFLSKFFDWFDVPPPAEPQNAVSSELLITRRLVNDKMAGAYHSVFKGRGMDFDEVRAVRSRRRRALPRLERLGAHR